MAGRALFVVLFGLVIGLQGLVSHAPPGEIASGMACGVIGLIVGMLWR